MSEAVSAIVETSVPAGLLVRFNEFLAERTGLYFPPQRLRDLERGIVSAASDFGFSNPEECLRHLTASPMTREQIEILASHLTVGETYFFREQKSLEALQTRVLPELTGARGSAERRIRIWSAGCATGEEPYSVAILLDAAFPELKDWSVTILGTDINPRFLEKAQAGVYGEWSFRDTPQWVRERYFKKTRKGFAVLPRIREMATFEYHNLAEDPYPSLLNSTNAMDIVFCRNVLMYFSPPRARNVVERFHRSLIDGGWLFVSPVETSQTLFSRFEAVNVDGVTLYRKGAEEQRSTGAEERILPAPEIVLPKQEVTRPQRPRPVLPKTAEPVPSPFPLPPGEKIKARGGFKEPGQYEKALLLYEQGLYAAAVEKIIPSGDKAGDEADVKAMALLARAMANQGRLADALQWCEKAISSDKLNAGLYYLAATVLQEQGQWEKAAVSLKQAIYLDRKFVLAHFALGGLARQQGKTKESEKHFENARALLQSCGHDDILPESEGMTAGRLREIIKRLTMDDR